MTGRADKEKEAAVADERKDRREVMAVFEHERNAAPESIVDSGSSVAYLSAAARIRSFHARTLLVFHGPRTA